MKAAVDVIEWGGERARVGPWRGDVRTAQLSPVPGAPLPSAMFLRRALGELLDRGFADVVTGALSPVEQRAFCDVGFEVRERLHLLAHDLRTIDGPVAAEAGLRRARKADRAEVLALDSRAFGQFWRLDDHSLDDALTATPVTRFRIAADGERIIGYAITGRSGRRGYLQRLAVDPDVHRRGIGRALVLDGLRWMRRWGVDLAVVNTQLDNEAALTLYRSLGFRLQPDGLAVLGRRLTE